MGESQKKSKCKKAPSKICDLSPYRAKKQRSKAIDSLRKKADELGW